MGRLTTHRVALRQVEVQRIEAVTPRLRRIVLGGERLGAFTNSPSTSFCTRTGSVPTGRHGRWLATRSRSAVEARWTFGGERAELNTPLGDDVFVFAAGETARIKAIRPQLTSELGLKPAQFKTANYW